MSQSPALKILIADDTDSDRMILESIVRQEGHTVISARDGAEAVQQFSDTWPDIVLLDALMPGLDGFEAAREIKQLAGETLVPIIFLTALTDTDSLVKCLEAGGDDFLQKPYNRVILQAKIKAFNRMRELHGTVLTQRNQIIAHNNHLIQEQTVAKQVFDRVAHSGCLDATNVRHYLSPRAVFNGDVLVAALRPSGSMLILLGDFTGHGLPAAIGAMPLASIFYGMVRKGFELTDILREINDKLKSILPIGLFCCVTFLEFNFQERRLTAWNGGLPDCFIHRRRSKAIEPIKSHHLPLGVLPSSQLKLDCEYFELDIGDRCYLWSDGIHEARNSGGEMFGEERLKAVFQHTDRPEKIFDRILDAVHEFIGGGEADDDLSLAEITMVEPGQVSSKAMPQQVDSHSGQMEWRLDFEMKPRTFQVFDPLPLLQQVAAEIPGLRSHSGSLYTILSELYSNALEHGILGLESALKQTPEGFSRYYELRRQRLATATEGYIRFHLSHDGRKDGGRLVIRVADSGSGFDYDRILDNPRDDQPYGGRGIPLVRGMCESLRYQGNGNEVVAVYRYLRG